jgi:hypothetical protein
MTSTAQAAMPEDNSSTTTGTEDALIAAGLKAFQPGASTEHARIILGTAGITAAGVVPVALRIEGGARAKAAWEAAVDRTATGALLARIASGWTETAETGAVQYLIGIDLGDYSDRGAVWETATFGIAAWAATTAAGSKIASLITTKAAVAPSTVGATTWKLASGATGQLTVITVSELLGIGVALDAASAEADPSSFLAYATRDAMPRTNAARDSFNRQVPENRVAKALRRAGWTVLDDSVNGTGAALLAAPGNPGTPVALLGGPLLPRGGMMTAEGVTLPAGFEADRAYRPFDILARVETDEQAYPGDFDATAERFLASGEARVKTAIHRAAAVVTVDSQATTVAYAAAIVDAVADARASHDASLPLAIQREVPGSIEQRQLLTVLPSGAMRVWGDPEDLMLAAVQPVVYFSKLDGAGEKGYKVVHNIPKQVVTKAVGSLTAPGALPAAVYVGSEPMITAKGEVVSEHGFHAAERMLLAIPENQRAAWAKVQVDRPTKAEAQASLDWLRAELTVDFPFETVGDEARYLALVLTGIARPITEQSPFFIANGSEVGTGKSLTTVLARLIASGTAAANSWKGGKANEEEDSKSLVAGARELNSRLWMHNDEAGLAADREGRIESGMVTAFTTGLDGENRRRVLGVSESVAVNGSIFTAAGNGIAPGGDLARRTLVYSMLIKSGVLAVERKAFRHADVISWVRSNRPLILQHAFTILAHGIQNPPVVPSYGFMGAWPRVILGSLDHLEMDGENAHVLVMDAMSAQMAGSQQSDDWAPLVSELSRLTAGTAFEAASARSWATFFKLEVPDLLTRRPAPTEVGQIKQWSRALNSIVNAKVTDADGFRFRLTEEVSGKKAKKFRIERFDPAGTESPETGTAAAVPTAADLYLAAPIGFRA